MPDQNEMNVKLALALVLALQVSVCLCEVPEPDKELVEKYEAMKSVFYKRLMNAYSKVQAAVGPMTESLGQGQGQAAKDYIEELQGNPKFLSAVKIGSGLAQEAAPLVDKARMAGLGLYGHYVRPHVGTYLDEAITSIKVYLDKVLPAED
uniref:Apolipoprotein A-II n=2 Tax=Salmo trutta TaxID=8032 RepID=A0A674B6S8_SALTR